MVPTADNPGFRQPDNVNPNWKRETPVPVAAAAFDGRKEKYVAHGNHVTVSLPFAPMKDLHDRLQQRMGLTLVSRGESHVTVLTPPEYDAIKALVPIKEIHALAKKRKLQSAKIQAVCLGQGQAQIGAEVEGAFFVVVKSNELLEFRREIRDLFLSRGGDKLGFVSDIYRPHVTIGFTKQDLHEADGVLKDERSCLYPLAVK